APDGRRRGESRRGVIADYRLAGARLSGWRGGCLSQRRFELGRVRPVAFESGAVDEERRCSVDAAAHTAGEVAGHPVRESVRFEIAKDLTGIRAGRRAV